MILEPSAHSLLFLQISILIYPVYRVGKVSQVCTLRGYDVIYMNPIDYMNNILFYLFIYLLLMRTLTQFRRWRV